MTSGKRFGAAKKATNLLISSYIEQFACQNEDRAQIKNNRRFCNGFNVGGK